MQNCIGGTTTEGIPARNLAIRPSKWQQAAKVMRQERHLRNRLNLMDHNGLAGDGG